MRDKQGGYFGNRLPVAIAFRNSVAWLDHCVCVRCGYVESYISEPDKLAEIAEKWPRV